MRQIILTLFVLTISIASIAQVSINGSVSNSEGVLPYATISIKGSQTGILADENGKFFIMAKKSDTLLISHVGLSKKEVIVGNEANFNIQLEPETLNEIIVVAQGIRKESMSFNCSGYRNHPAHTLTCCANGIVIALTQKELPLSNSLKLYPNPSRDGYFNLNFSKMYREASITVASLTGQTLFSKFLVGFHNTMTVDLSDYPSGIYIINVTVDGKNHSTLKAVKN